MRPGRHTQNILVVVVVVVAVAVVGGLSYVNEGAAAEITYFSAFSVISSRRIAQPGLRLLPVSLIKNNQQFQGHGARVSGLPPLLLTIVRLN
jgi:hypothetical protein